MRIQNYESIEINTEFERVLTDIATRELPDCGLYVTHESGMQWNGHPLDTLSAKHPTVEGQAFHFGIILATGPLFQLRAITCSTNRGELSWYQDFEVQLGKIVSLSYEIARFFLEKTGVVKTDREGVELLYPAYGLPVPDLKAQSARTTFRTPVPTLVESL